MVWGGQARTEDEEVDSLRRMFASSGGGHRDAQQDDHLPIGTFMKLLVANENRKGAARCLDSLTVTSGTPHHREHILQRVTCPQR